MTKINRVILQLFKYIFESLESGKIEYLLSGSYALNIYSTPRMTRDIDIVVNLNERNLPGFLSIFSEDYYFHKEAIVKEVKARRIFNIIHKGEGFKFDFIVKPNDEFSNTMFERKHEEKIDGFTAWVISPEDLMISKLKWIQTTGSEMHLRDMQNLLGYPGIDISYIKKWCLQLNLQTFNLPL